MDRKDVVACFRLHLEPIYHERKERSIGNPFQGRVTRTCQWIIEVIGADANGIADPPGLLHHELIGEQDGSAPDLARDEG